MKGWYKFNGVTIAKKERSNEDFSFCLQTKNDKISFSVDKHIIDGQWLFSWIMWTCDI